MSDQPELEAAAKQTPRGLPQWEERARERLRGALKKYQRPLESLVARDANEGDTRHLITDILCDGFGFDKYEDLTTEYQVRGEFADYGVRMEARENPQQRELVAFIEVKRAKTPLSAKHLRQVESYAVNEGVEWAILTNGARWQVYHLGATIPLQVDLAIDVDLLGPETPNAKINQLFYLTRESFKRRQINDLWQAKRASSPKSIATIAQSEAVLDAIRKELRRQTGHNIDLKELAATLKTSVIRQDAS